MKKILFSLLFTSFVLLTYAQEPYYKTYDWDANPQYEIDKTVDKEILSLKDKMVKEFFFTGENELVEYLIEHKVLWLNSDQNIEDYNKVYLPYSSNSELIISKARVITKEGKIIELDESKILTAKNEETKKTYKYFAFEGVEKKSFIEYFYIVKKYPSYRGVRIDIQSEFDKKNVDFELYSPSNLIFEFKSYNGLKSVEKDTLTDKKLHWVLHLDSIEGLDREQQASYNASKKFLVYKLDRNTYNNTHNISSYAKVSQNIYSFFYKEYSKSVLSAINKLIKSEGINKKNDEVSKIRALETYIKSNFFISDVKNDELEDLSTIIQKKVANEDGIIKLYVATLQALKIKHEIVLTSNRFKLKFDKDFEANNFLTNYLIYFPKQETYISPVVVESRYGFPPFNLTDNYGLFIKEVTLGDFKSGVGKIKYIKASEANETYDNVFIDVKFDKDDLTKTVINLDKSITGYYAMYIQPYMNLIKEEKKDEITDSFIKTMGENIEITNKEVFNGTPELFGIKPFRVTSEVTSEYFVEKAGRKYLFKVGELIGPQMELYQEKARVLPVESQFKRSYLREITIEIPEGYSVSNLHDINIDNFYEKDGEKLMVFKSFYTQEGNMLKITSNEFYKLNFIDIDIYEDYRKVINSAADFNKITLIFEPN